MAKKRTSYVFVWEDFFDLYYEYVLKIQHLRKIKQLLKRFNMRFKIIILMLIKLKLLNNFTATSIYYY